MREAIIETGGRQYKITELHQRAVQVSDPDHPHNRIFLGPAVQPDPYGYIYSVTDKDSRVSELGIHHPPHYETPEKAVYAAVKELRRLDQQSTPPDTKNDGPDDHPLGQWKNKLFHHKERRHKERR